MHRTYQILYRLGITPWDAARIPAPLTAAVETLAGRPGIAVDLGCGTGRQARYLAARGWSVTAADYIPKAIKTARQHDPDGLITWRVADVTQVAAVDPDGSLAGTITLLLDNGCLHGIPDQRRPGWAHTIHTLAAPGCLLLARGAPRRHHGPGPRGIHTHELAALLGRGWRLGPSPGPGWYRYTHP